MHIPIITCYDICGYMVSSMLVFTIAVIAKTDSLFQHVYLVNMSITHPKEKLRFNTEFMQALRCTYIRVGL